MIAPRESVFAVVTCGAKVIKSALNHLLIDSGTPYDEPADSVGLHSSGNTSCRVPIPVGASVGTIYTRDECAAVLDEVRLTTLSPALDQGKPASGSRAEPDGWRELTGTTQISAEEEEK